MDEAAAVALQTRMADLCGHLNVVHAQLVDAVVEALDGGLWEQWGIRSPEHWLAWQTGLSPGRARQLVDTARRARELPVTFAAFADGELSVDQVVTVAKYTPAHNDAEACELARSATVNQLRHALSRYVHVVNPAPEVTPTEAVLAVTGVTRWCAGSTSTAATRCNSTPPPIRVRSSTKRSEKPATPCSWPATPQ